MMKKTDFYVAVVCSANMNRSMQAQAILESDGFRVRSYGTSVNIKLPGKTKEEPNVYEFGTDYQVIYADLERKDKSYYMQIGVLQLLERNLSLKICPERFQDSSEVFDVIVSLDQRVFERVLEHMHSRPSILNKPVHLLNVDTKDTFQGAVQSSFLISDLLKKLIRLQDLDNEIGAFLGEFERERCKPILHTVLFY